MWFPPTMMKGKCLHIAPGGFSRVCFHPVTYPVRRRYSAVVYYLPRRDEYDVESFRLEHGMEVQSTQFDRGDSPFASMRTRYEMDGMGAMRKREPYLWSYDAKRGR